MAGGRSVHIETPLIHSLALSEACGASEDFFHPPAATPDWPSPMPLVDWACRQSWWCPKSTKPRAIELIKQQGAQLRQWQQQFEPA
jgi:hypothetical protein